MASFEQTVRHHVRYSLAKDWSDVTAKDVFHAACLAIKERAIEGLLNTEKRCRAQDTKRLYYLSMEFLVGRTLEHNVMNLGLQAEFEAAVKSFGMTPEQVLEEESDPALGNGGLGRLAACFLDSLATQGLPGYGYGINYKFGLFRQAIENGCQKEKPDRWLDDGMYAQIQRADKLVSIPIYGRVEMDCDVLGNPRPRWVETRTLLGVPHDLPVVGHGGETVNFLRLYSARASNDFDMDIFNHGDYRKAVSEKVHSETVSKVLYPSDADPIGRELRFVQEYFFVACALRDIFRRYRHHHPSMEGLKDKVAIQMNDTHPSIAVAELMRLLVDDYAWSWDAAWAETQAIFGYTNHTLLSEALERWPVALFEKVLPRHLQIIYEINRRLMIHVETLHPGNGEQMRSVSLIEEGPVPHVRMAHLAIAGSHSVNGVAALHSQLIQKTLVPQFYALWPERFTNKTNGVTPRRWLAKCNPSLAAELDRLLGNGWVKDLSQLSGLLPLADRREVHEVFAAAKRINKHRLAAFVRDTQGKHINPNSFFDVQAKRIHLYKRQLLNLLRVIHDYLRVAEDRVIPQVPQTFLFSGKAAPGYWEAKQVIRLVHALADVVNQDPRTRDCLTVAFLPDYRVTVAEVLIPAADLSEQISTAGFEASGTGNMKFALNGALTIGTYDGATLEMAEKIGPEKLFLFGLKAPEVQAIHTAGSYDPRAILAENAWARRVLENLKDNRFSRQDPGLFDGLVNALLNPHDPFLHLADFESYRLAHEEAVALYSHPDAWQTRVIQNVAGMGYFSSDRTIQDYARDIWQIQRPAA